MYRASGMVQGLTACSIYRAAAIDDQDVVDIVSHNMVILLWSPGGSTALEKGTMIEGFHQYLQVPMPWHHGELRAMI